MDNYISKNESLALRGVCITMIVLHNFIHSVVPFHENEKSFSVIRADFFVNNIFDQPILGTISYLGWLGVPMFFFLSGYGLNKKYGNQLPNKLFFIKWHYFKLLLLAGPIILFSNILASTPISQIVGQLSLINTFFDLKCINPISWIRPASFWYIRVALEFYILYAILLYRINSKLLLALAFVANLSLFFFDWSTVRILKYHHTGWLFVFSLGIFTAKNPQWTKYLNNAYIPFLLFVLLIISNINQYLWYFCDVISVVFLLSIKKYITNKYIVFIGTISAFLYVTHTAVRNPWLSHIKLDYTNGNLLLITLSICSFYLTCLVVAYIYGLGYKKALSFINKKANGKNES